MFLDTMEPITENKNSSLDKICLDNLGSDTWNNCLKDIKKIIYKIWTSRGYFLR